MSSVTVSPEDIVMIQPMDHDPSLQKLYRHFIQIGKKTVICVLRADNGYTVEGLAHCGDPDHFVLETGQQESYKRATGAFKEAYAYHYLESKPSLDHLVRIQKEFHELDGNIDRLQAFLNNIRENGVPGFMDQEDVDLLKEQLGQMMAYATTLRKRIQKENQKRQEAQ